MYIMYGLKVILPLIQIPTILVDTEVPPEVNGPIPQFLFLLNYGYYVKSLCNHNKFYI